MVIINPEEPEDDAFRQNDPQHHTGDEGEALDDVRSVMTPDVLTSRNKLVYECVKAAGAHGITGRELTELMNNGEDMQSWQPRLSWLADPDRALIVKTKSTRFSPSGKGRKGHIWVLPEYAETWSVGSNQDGGEAQ